MKLTMRVDQLIPHVSNDVRAMLESAEAAEREAEKMPKGKAQMALQRAARAILENNEDLRTAAAQEMAHVSFWDGEGVLGCANFLVNQGELEAGKTYIMEAQ